MKLCHVFSTCPPGKGIGFSFDLQAMFYVKFIEINPVILETEIDNYVQILQRCRCRCVLIDRQRMKAQKVHLYFQWEPVEVSLIFGCTRIIFFCIYFFFNLCSSWKSKLTWSKDFIIPVVPYFHSISPEHQGIFRLNMA